MKKIAVLTSGGDAPGMNAAIRAVVRAGIGADLEVLGVSNGYAGLIAGEWCSLSARDVGGILQTGGTFLGSARCPEFQTDSVRRDTVARLRKAAIDGLVVIGGGGSQTGACEVARLGFPVAGVASTIDNDLFGSDITIGVDTALNIALEAIDRLKNTAASHHRAFLVEVMGRNCGYLALMAGISGGAEAVVLPEFETSPDGLAGEIDRAYERGKTHALVVVAEGSRYNAAELVAYFKQHQSRLGFELRATTLGHVQRGGNPGAFDRILATRLGAAAVHSLVEGNFGQLLGQVDNHVVATPLETVVHNKKELDPYLFELAKMMAK